MCFFFFFQAEDGIRDLTVTGVQTCALPICAWVLRDVVRERSAAVCGGGGSAVWAWRNGVCGRGFELFGEDDRARPGGVGIITARSRRGTRAAAGGWAKKKVASDPELERNLKSLLEV